MNESSEGIIHSAQRVGVFIDVQNIYHSVKNLYGCRVHFDILLKAVIAGRPLVRAVAYVAKSETAMGEDSFFEALRKTGLELRSKDLQVYADGTKKADWDVGMAVDAMRMANFLDVIILVTGDGDFIPLVEYLKWGMGRQVEVAGFEKTTSSRLREAADRFVALDGVPRILLKSRSMPRRAPRR
ncbi:MAG: NYN domain-containing protein [Nanoarchaeota archaeon]|nr:NYN domain-containing protein [Nanoarchaeota archaeon]